MHPKKLARTWAVAGLVAIGLTVLCGSPVGAQDPKDPKTPPMATPDPSGAIQVPHGAQIRVQMKSKKRIKEAFNHDDRVVQVLADAQDPTTLILIARLGGKSRLDMVDVDGGKESYLIIVETDDDARRKRAEDELRKLIKRTIPTANVEVIPIGEGVRGPSGSDPNATGPTPTGPAATGPTPTGPAGTSPSGTGGRPIIISGYVAREDDRETIRLLAESVGLRVVVNTASVGGGGNVPHVQLDVTVAKVDRTRARSRGANFIINGGTASGGSILGGLTSLTPGNVGTSAPNVLGLGATPQTGIFAPAASANLLAGYAPWNLQAILAALKTEGLAKLVAAPTIVARSGEEANILVGGRVPVIGPSSGITGPGVVYEDIGTELRFTPVVYGNGKIHLDVAPRVRLVNNAQALTTAFGTSPAFEEQRMRTSVIVEPGQTIAIGGLIQTTQQGTVTKIPHLGDIPYLGFLFSFATQTEQEIELVILLTPRLVDPADCNQMPKALPGSETRKPDDFEFYLETILEAPRGQRPIWTGTEYTPAWKSSHTADTFPCQGGTPVNGPVIGPESKYPGASSGKPGAGMVPATQKRREEPPIAALDIVPPPLVSPKTAEQKTAELPRK
jgi:pilus assembly protein CpaC